ncbi:MAG: hypothetical protein ISR95_07590 [Candidatus Marinimicrobia bacterium]|nr:hypothetical protein [Candidatus Neomarinimicrobiota bacterium]
MNRRHPAYEASRGKSYVFNIYIFIENIFMRNLPMMSLPGQYKSNQCQMMWDVLDQIETY